MITIPISAFWLIIGWLLGMATFVVLATAAARRRK